MKLTIIILSFNTKELTIRAVLSCLQLKDAKIVVVDNNSQDNTVAELKKLEKEHKNLSVKVLVENIGFAAGNNVALRKINTEYVMLLNSDAYLLANSSLDIIDYLDSNPQVGVITPKVVLSNGKIDPACHRGFPTPWNAFCYYSGLEKMTESSKIFGGYHLTSRDLTTTHSIDSCSGAAMIVRKRAMDEVGLLDERFFMYAEDIDWCFRFKEKSWDIMYYPQLTVCHDKHTSGMKKKSVKDVEMNSTRIREKSITSFFDAMKIFYKKHYKNTYPKLIYYLVIIGISVMKYIKLHKRHQ